MNCPVCQKPSFITTELQQGLDAQTCSQCQGIWISSTHYFDWLKHHGPNLPEREAPNTPLATGDPDVAKICPDCRHLLRRYQIWPDIAFYVDHCSSCNGMWFDRGEWAVLEARNLHDDLNLFFTKNWQIKLKAEETHRHLDQFYRSKFGSDDYFRIQELRAWLLNHPQRAALLAFLQAEDPYKN